MNNQNNNMPQQPMQPVNNVPQQPVQPMNNMPQQPMQPVNNIPQQPVQPMNNMPQQPVQPVNNIPQQPVQPMNNIPQQPVQPMNNIPQQPVQPMNNIPQQPVQPMNNIPQHNKSNNIIYIIVALLVIVAIVSGCIFFFGGSDEKENKKGINEYEEKDENNVNNDNDIEIPNNNSNNDDSYTYAGFKLKKASGYTYVEEDGMLSITSNKLSIALRIENIYLSTIKANIEELKSTMEASGFIINNYSIDTISGEEVILFDMEKDGVSGIYFIFEPYFGYTFDGIVMNYLGTSNRDDVSTVIKVIGDPTYVGNYAGYSSEFDVDINKFLK